jgi:polyhydroxybutyrate depolymerase
MQPVRLRRAWSVLFSVMAVVALAGACSSDDGEVSAAGDGGTASTTAPTEAGDVVPSEGCGTSTVGAVDKEERTITSGGTERMYLLTTPAAHDGETPIPLVLDFHGLIEGAHIHSQMSSLGDLAKQEGFVVAFPNGTGDPLRWNSNPAEENNPDIAYTSDLLDTLETELCIDTSRVYAAGLSNGAMMSSVLACRLSDRIAAVAPVAGVMAVDPCPAARAVPVVAFHGTADNFIPFNGGLGGGLSFFTDPGAPTTSSTTVPVDLTGPGIPEAVAGWAERNGCEPEPSEEQVTDEVLLHTWDCPDGADVQFYIVVGGGHAWPGSEFSKAQVAVMGHTTFDISANDLMWEFFQQHQLPTT